MIAAVGLLCAISAAAQQNDWLIVPGKRAGPLTVGANRADLIRIFGKANVRDRAVDTGEGPEPITVIYPESPSAELGVSLQNGRVDRILICFERQFGTCKWHTEDGVSLGTSLLRLEALNGRPFEIEAWGTDMGGNIISWKGGNLEGFGSGPGWHLALEVGWQQPPDGPTPRQSRLGQALDLQKRNPTSSDPPLRKLHPVVIGMVLVLREGFLH